MTDDRTALTEKFKGLLADYEAKNGVTARKERLLEINRQHDAQHSHDPWVRLMLESINALQD